MTGIIMKSYIFRANIHLKLVINLTIMIIRKITKKTILLAIIYIVFTIIFCLISLVNQYQFRTAAQDLGMNNHAIYSYAHFTTDYYTLAVGDFKVNYLADHFSPITFLYAPFYYLFGSYTLLIIQIVSILFGGFGVYKYAENYFKDSYMPVLIVLHFFGLWGIYSALSYDFHNNVIAAMLVPWLLYHYEKNEKKLFLVYYALILISKENMALWLVFILIGLFIKHKLNPIKGGLKFETPILIFTIFYFVLVMGFIMPELRDGAGKSQMVRYNNLGYSLPGIMSTLLHKPLYVLSLFFSNPSNKHFLDGIKAELHIMVLISGGIAILFRPYYLIMLLPIYAQKMLTYDYAVWGISNQYSIEFVPIISLALIELVAKFKNEKHTNAILILIILLTHIANIHTINSRKAAFYDSTNTAFYQSKHYDSQLNLSEIYKQIGSLPKNAILSVSTNLAPHLAFREKIYLFPHVRDAQYIVLFTDKRSSYPLGSREFQKKIEFYKDSSDFEAIYDANDLLILKK